MSDTSTSKNNISPVLWVIIILSLIGVILSSIAIGMSISTLNQGNDKKQVHHHYSKQFLDGKHHRKSKPDTGHNKPKCHHWGSSDDKLTEHLKMKKELGHSKTLLKEQATKTGTEASLKALAGALKPH